MKRSTTAVLALVMLALTAGCGQGGENNGDPPAGEELPSQSDSPPPPETFPVSGEFWHAGFHVTLTSATIAARPHAFTDAWQRTLTIDAQFSNLGPNQTSFRSDVAVVAGGTSYVSNFESELPPVPSGLTGEGRLAFDVDDTFDHTTAHLLVGSGNQTQARVPLGAQGGELVTLAPQEPDVTGIASLERVDIRVTGAELRADVPVNYLAVPQGRLALTLHLTATSRRSGSWVLFPNFFALVTPNGTAVGVDGAELGSIRGNDAGIDTDGLYVRFLVPDPAAGQYTLRFTPSGAFSDDADDPDGATLTFVL